MPERLLVVAYSFPPIAAPESILVAKALHSLRTWEVDAVCAERAPWQRRDISLMHYAESAVNRLDRVRQPRWLPIVQPIRAVRQFPDAMVFLRARALQAALTLEPDRYNALLTWSQWHSAHLVGLDLKRRFATIPWIAHFSDPWVDNPLRPVIRPARTLALRMEAAVIEQADAVLFTTELTRDLVMRKYPAAWVSKTTVIPHCFDPALYPATESSTGPLMVRHIGSFYRERTPDPVLRAFVRLADATASLLGDVRVEIVGKVDLGIRKRAAGVPLPRGFLHVRPPVDYVDSLALMRTSDLLLLVDAPAERSVFLASKAIDYMGARRPIVAVTPPGTTADVMRRYGAWVADPRDPDGIAEALRDALAFVREHRPAIWGAGHVLTDYTIERVGKQRDEAIRGARVG